MKRRCPSAKITSKASELLPDPLGPVTTHSFPWGTRQLTSFKLCSLACSTVCNQPPRARARARSSVFFSFFLAPAAPTEPSSARSASPVFVPLAATSSGVPTATTTPPCGPAARPEIDDPLRLAHHREIVLDHHHAGALFDEASQRADHVLGILCMQACARLVHHEQRAARVRRERARELEPLAPRRPRASTAAARAAGTRARRGRAGSACSRSRSRAGASARTWRSPRRRSLPGRPPPSCLRA